MTPNRKKYFDKCSKRELLLRAFIVDEKLNIKRYKKSLNNPQERGSYSADLILVKYSKFHLNAYRHELARLKGLYRVVVPREIYLSSYGEYCFECKCGHEVEVNFYEYCPLCGRRVLEKGEKNDVWK